MQRRELYSLQEEKVARSRRFCPRCGPGVFLAEHEDRFTCGNCKYSETKKTPPKPSPEAEKPKDNNA